MIQQARLLSAPLLLAWLCLFAAQSHAEPEADAPARIAVVSAFAPELDAILERTDVEDVTEINGISFYSGTLSDRHVVVFTSGISMVNAAMATQLALERFNIRAIVVSGIAGGVDPAYRIGDVIVPARWGQYLEALYAREVESGYAPPHWFEPRFDNFGMMFPQEVKIRSSAHPSGTSRFWFEVDPELLEVARSVTGQVDLASCVRLEVCLTNPPRLVVGGHGVSGSAFVDNAAFRQYVLDTFEARILDMETAAIGTVAFANDVPFIAFRSLSDLAGGGDGENEIETFMGLAAENAAEVLTAFVRAIPE